MAQNKTRLGKLSTNEWIWKTNSVDINAHTDSTHISLNWAASYETTQEWGVFYQGGAIGKDTKLKQCENAAAWIVSQGLFFHNIHTWLRQKLNWEKTYLVKCYFFVFALFFFYFSTWWFEYSNVKIKCSERKVERARCSELIICPLIEYICFRIKKKT